MVNVKRIVMILAVLALLMTPVMIFAGGQKDAPAAAGGDKVKVVFYANGTFGDKSFFDSAARGVNQAVEELGIVGKVIEGGYDPSRWEPDITQLAQGDWDIIIAGTWQLQEILEKLGPLYPDKHFFTFDTSVNYELPGTDKIYSITYKQNEASFLVGALAAMITASKMPLANAQKVVGFLGGMDIGVINDFKIGYEEGVKYVDPSVKVLVAYAGAWNDPAKGKELTLAMYDQGADITFNVAGETGLGGIDAAKERGKYTFGVDSDQYLLFADTDPAKAANIVTSMMKNVDNSIYRGIKMHLDGTLPYGSAEALGIAEGGVGVAYNENYNKLVPEEMRNKIKAIEDQILAGKIKVGTAF
jgi:basic membrane protein A